MAHIPLDRPSKSQKLLPFPQNGKVQFFFVFWWLTSKPKFRNSIFILIDNENHKSPETYLKSSDVMVTNPHQKILIPWRSVVYILKWFDTMLSGLFCLFFKLWILKVKTCIVMLSLSIQTRHTFLDCAFIQMFVQ